MSGAHEVVIAKTNPPSFTSLALRLPPTVNSRQFSALRTCPAFNPTKSSVETFRQRRRNVSLFESAGLRPSHSMYAPVPGPLCGCLPTGNDAPFMHGMATGTSTYPTSLLGSVASARAYHAGGGGGQPSRVLSLLPSLSLSLSRRTSRPGAGRLLHLQRSELFGCCSCSAAAGCGLSFTALCRLKLAPGGPAR